jgi:hypothetical protein
VELMEEAGLPAIHGHVRPSAIPVRVLYLRLKAYLRFLYNVPS